MSDKIMTLESPEVQKVLTSGSPLKESALTDFIKIHDFRHSIHEWQREMGFYDDEKYNKYESKFMLAITELSEAIEADRVGRRADANVVDAAIETSNFMQAYKSQVKGTMEEELADFAIRILGLIPTVKEYTINVLPLNEDEEKYLLGFTFLQHCWFITKALTGQGGKLDPVAAINRALVILCYVSNIQGISIIREIEFKMKYNLEQMDTFSKKY